ncbi:MAG: hypothetical protein ABIZ95_01615, partial [Pyrinomonadaceae bacterium]
MSSVKKLKLQVWILVLVVFVLGATTGASIDALYRQRQAQAMQAQREAAANSILLVRMMQELDLTNEQVVQIREVLLSARKEMSLTPGIKEIRDNTNVRIKALLTPEQQALYT